jgi:hypothetical protein
MSTTAAAVEAREFHAALGLELGLAVAVNADPWAKTPVRRRRVFAGPCGAGRGRTA